MKTHTIKTPKAELMIVELLENTKSWEFLDGKFWADDKQLFINGFTPFYTLLGKPDEIREEDARELVELPIDKWGDDKFKFLDYCHDGHYDLFTAKESLLSLIESEIYWDVNPIPTPEIQGGYDEFGNFHGGWDDNWILAFEEAEQKTFDRKRSLIFKKNT